VTAQDWDVTSPNNLVNYAIISGDGGHFQVGTQSGEIRIVAPMDADSGSSRYLLIVRASDRGHPTLQTQQTITIMVRMLHIKLIQTATEFSKLFSRSEDSP